VKENAIRIPHLPTQKQAFSALDSEYFRVYNCINSKKGALTMFAFCFYAANNKSGNPMRWHGVGLTLSYSF
jgi:hypothetical protein